MATNLTSLPNQFTPLAFLSPVSAGRVQAAAYISVAVLAVSFRHSTIQGHGLWLNLLLFVGVVMGLANVYFGRDPYVSK
jgi:hypothetical protein